MHLYLCGALLGLSQEDLRGRLQQILEFGALEEYRYTPMSELSGGYAARVPFAAAVHADADVLLVDEILAVGDMRFQGKCLEVFERAKRDGKTLLIATHSADVVTRFCDRALYLDRGCMAALGQAPEVWGRYTQDARP